MKRIVLFLGLALISLKAVAQEETVTITVTIENVLNDEGTVLVSLHTSDTFMKGGGIIDLAEKAKKGQVTLSFENVQPGTYAIMAMHDANNNKRMDYESNGMPKESYGMSRNDMAMGPPTFDAAKFVVTNEDISFNIRF
ncbi:MAG: DUF2141 domain-containing protein [Bacteroidota bacterium]